MQGQFSTGSNTGRGFTPPGLVNFQKKGKLNWTRGTMESLE